MPLSPWQLKRQLAYLAASVAFAETPQGLVFPGGGYVSEDFEGDFMPGQYLVDGPVSVGLLADGGIQPFCRVESDVIRFDTDAPSRILELDLRLWGTAGGGIGKGGASPNQGDPGAQGNTSASTYDTHGVNQVTGANRASPNGQGQAQGRDVDELLLRFVESLNGFGFVDSTHGFQGMVKLGEKIDTVHGVQVLRRMLRVRATNAIVSNFYAPSPGPFVGFPFGFHSVGLTWIAPPKRFDTWGPIVRAGNNPGDPAPTTPTSGRGVGLTSPTTAVDGPFGSQQAYNYALFYGYTETPAAVQANAPDRYSASITTGAQSS